MIDIADKLFPNITTILVQLMATGIIFILYRRFLHAPVMNYLDQQAEDLAKAQNYSKIVQEEAEEKKAELEADYDRQVAAMRQANQAMKKETERERAEILRQAERERDYLLSKAQAQIDKERASLEKEAENHVLDLAVHVSKRALEDMSYDEGDMLRRVEREWEKAK